MKICTKCKKPGRFQKDCSKKDGLHSICAMCHSIARKLLRTTNQEWVNKERQKSKEYRQKYLEKVSRGITCATLRKKYNISLAQYNEILSLQNGVCKVCNSPPTKQRLHVDHDHTNKQIRGLLCQACNVSIGKMKESPELLRKLADYVENSKSKSYC